MSRWPARALDWTGEVEDDVAGSSFHVFVPSIMGVGILASLAILLVDGVRALNPRRNPARRRALVQRRAQRLVVPVAAAIGVQPPIAHPPLRRRLRSRRSYAVIFVVSTAISLYVAIGSTANYLRPGGYLEGVVWMQALASFAALFFIGIGVVALVLFVCHPGGPRWARAIVDHSPFGVLD